MTIQFHISLNRHLGVPGEWDGVERAGQSDAKSIIDGRSREKEKGWRCALPSDAAALLILCASIWAKMTNGWGSEQLPAANYTFPVRPSSACQERGTKTSACLLSKRRAYLAKLVVGMICKGCNVTCAGYGAVGDMTSQLISKVRHFQVVTCHSAHQLAHLTFPLSTVVRGVLRQRATFT